jgi:hypothetical protein
MSFTNVELRSEFSLIFELIWSVKYSNLKSVICFGEKSDPYPLNDFSVIFTTGVLFTKFDITLNEAIAS